jgi:hypothetical protein
VWEPKFLEGRWEDENLNRMVAHIPQIKSAYNSSWMQLWFVTVVPRPHLQRIYLQSVNSHFVLHVGDERTICLVFSIFTCRQTSLLACTSASLFFFMVFTFSPSLSTWA